jgi:hypothetical protein
MVEASDPTEATSDVTEAAPEELSELPDGVYRVEISLDDVEAAGHNNSDGTTGIWTIEIDDGTWVGSCAPLDLPGTDCGNNLDGGILAAGDLHGAGHTASFSLDVELVSELTGCQLPASNEPGHCGVGPDFHVDWALDGDTLILSNFGPGNGPLELTIKPWTRIEGAVQPDAETASFPEGVYRAELLIPSIFGPDPVLDQLTFENGMFEDRAVNEPGACVGTYETDAGRVRVILDAGSCGGDGESVLFDARWTLDGDQLRFTDIENEAADNNAQLIFGSKPWTKVE